jgi:hypothetical protein
VKYDFRSAIGARRMCLALVCVTSALAVGGAWGAATASADVTGYTRHLKLALIHNAPAAPQLVVYGGSRAEKAQPAYLEKLTGIPGFNASVMSCRPSDVLAIASYLHDRALKMRQFPVWILSMETFRDNGFFQGELLSMPELLAELPADLLAGVTPLPPVAYSLPADLTCADGTVWSPDGYLLVSRYEVMLAHGVSREKLTATRLKIYLDSYHDWSSLSVRAAQVVETTIARMNRWRWRPVIVLPPYHPYVLAAIRPLGWGARHKEVLAYLAELQTRYNFVVIDLSDIRSFGGSASGFYDGVHGGAYLMRQVLSAVVERSDRALDPTVPYNVRR